MLIDAATLRFSEFNDAACGQLGYSRDELIGRTFQGLAHPEDAAEIWAQAKGVLSGAASTSTLDKRYVRKDGGLVWVRITVSLLRDAAGEPLNLIAAIEDIDDRVRAEQELRAANHDLEQFAYSASHDLKEPLRNVAIYSELLRDRYQGKLDAQADRFLHFIVEGATRMGMLVSDLLCYVESTQFDEEPVGLVKSDQVLEGVMTTLEPSIRETEAVVTHDALPEVRVKEFHLQQLLQNLIANSIKYRKDSERPRIHISAMGEDGSWRFSVRDNGIGIAPEFHHKVFGLFKRLHTRSSKYGGTGIGLAICQKVVERYGSRIWLESEPEKGTVVHFTLPRGVGGA